MTAVERFWSNVDKTGDCWEWRLYRDVKGYGRLTFRRKQGRLAHQVSWELTNGPIPKGFHVLHRCDNRACVNPAHLFLGTNADNVADMMSKGRHGNTACPGEKNPNAKLTRVQVAEIREMRKAGQSVRDVAAHFGVCEATVGHITTGRNWASVPL